MSLKLNGATSGSIELDVPAAIGSDLSVTLPATAGEIVVANTSGDVDLGGLTVSGSAADDSVNIDSSGRLLIGTNSSVNVASTSASLLQVEHVAGNISASFYSTVDALGPAGVLALGHGRGSATGLLQNNDVLGQIRFAGGDGTDLVTTGAQISAEADNTPGANNMPTRLVFSTTADGASSPTEAVRIDSSQRLISVPTYNATSGSAANVGISGSGRFFRSTSSIKYKTDIETIEDSYADALLDCRPVWYRSTSPEDPAEYSYWGFIAEEVAAIDPRLVHWKTIEVTYDENGSAVETPCDPEPEGVAYDRFVPHLLNLIKRQKQAIETLEAKVAVLEANP